MKKHSSSKHSNVAKAKSQDATVMAVKKRSIISWIKRHKLASWLLFILLALGVSSVLGLVLVENNEPVTPQVNIAAPSKEAIAENLKNKLDSGIAADASIDEKIAYYGEVLANLSSLGDTQQTARIYIDTIAPLAVTFDSDTQAWIISSLIANGYTAEAKVAIALTIQKLQADINEVPAEYKESVQATINSYTSLGAQL